VNFILNSEGSLALAVPVGCLPHTFLQSLQECRFFLKSRRVALLSQD
jgi:hypothetical protein